MQYKEIQANNGTIAIGYIGDNLATKVLFDTTEIIQTYGDGGSFELLVKQQTQKHCPPIVYPAVIEENTTTDHGEDPPVVTNSVIWIPQAQDTSYGQYMDVELVYTIDDQVAYNKVYRCVLKKSLAEYCRGTRNPESAWVTQVIKAGVDAKQSAEDASGSASDASDAADQAKSAAESATESAGTASRAATTATEAAAQAKTAADSVTPATVAETKSYLGI